jgi:hypothetical protein
MEIAAKETGSLSPSAKMRWIELKGAAVRALTIGALAVDAFALEKAPKS